ncbi:histidine kinase [Nonomuraea sp. NPDC046570]|uniref:sensor histidine kinase n=1 Tax=Nonomuraea sp. NPDC046570 TaxID=3155255 RepID=UPI0033ED9705
MTDPPPHPIRRLWDRLSDLPVVFILVWAGWLAVPWSLHGLAQSRTATAPPHDLPAKPLTPSLLPAPATSLPAATLAVLGAPPSTTVAGVTDSDGDAGGHATVEFIARERARIAGEVHDAAGHGLAAIAMQAGIALLMLEENPAQARESLQAIRDTSTQALAHLRTALDAMDPARATFDGAAVDTAHPTRTGEEDLPRLIDGIRAAGLRVDLEPAVPRVPAHLRGTVYRVVRESLTNVLRHAGATRALVRVANDPCEFVLEVADSGRAAGGAWSQEGDGPQRAGSGRGLVGMRARVVAAGGDFHAGPREEGGFEVRARFPRGCA